MSQVTSLRGRHRFNSRMIRIVLFIGFLFLFGRFVYSTIDARYYRQDKRESQQTTQPQQTASAQTDEH